MEHFRGLTFTIDGSQSVEVKTRRGVANPDGLARQFEGHILRVLNDINSDAQVGNAVLRSVGIGHQIRIVPATELVTSSVSRTDMMPPESGGSGRGSDGIVFVRPQMLKMASGPAAQQDAILLHEIFHAIRMTRGLFNAVGMVGYENIEEFFAVTVSNIYVSSKYPGTPLRGDHRLFPLHKPGYPQEVIGVVSNPGLEENKLYYFVMHHREDLLKFNDQMEDVAFRLASAKCRFNPFRVLYSGYDPDVEEVDVSADRRRKQGYGPLVKETFAQAADRAMKDIDPEMWK